MLNLSNYGNYRPSVISSFSTVGLEGLMGPDVKEESLPKKKKASVPTEEKPKNGEIMIYCSKLNQDKVHH